MLKLWQASALLILSTLTVLSSADYSYSADKADPELCMKKKVSGRGRPNRIRAMASMNAVIQWINLAKKKHGEKYAQWHSAFEPKISCEKIKDSDYHICHAAGKPCKMVSEKDKKAKGVSLKKLKKPDAEIEKKE